MHCQRRGTMAVKDKPYKSHFCYLQQHNISLTQENLLNAVQLYDSKTESDRLSSPIEVL